jgi:hypothetical protein
MRLIMMAGFMLSLIRLEYTWPSLPHVAESPPPPKIHACCARLGDGSPLRARRSPPCRPWLELPVGLRLHCWPPWPPRFCRQIRLMRSKFLPILLLLWQPALLWLPAICSPPPRAPIVVALATAPPAGDPCARPFGRRSSGCELSFYVWLHFCLFCVHDTSQLELAW